MSLVAEADVEKDHLNRVTLPADVEHEHFRMKRYDDGHIELWPRSPADTSISRDTLRDMDEAMANFQKGRVGEALEIEALEALAYRSE